MTLWKIMAGCGLLGLAAAGGYGLARLQPAESRLPAPPVADVQEGRRVLYWYDPMYPQQHFDQPGPSPFMEMALVPRYAGDQDPAAGVRIDSGMVQNLGIRLAPVLRQPLAEHIEASGVLAFNGRDVAVLQARRGGFVERVYDRAPEDVIVRGAPLVELLVPEWAALQEEFLALRGLGQPELLAAARQRLRLAGMPEALIRQVEQRGRVQDRWTLTAPIGGMLAGLEVRQGMSLADGQTVARINGLASVWLEVAVPEAQSTGLAVGQPVEARLPALPGQPLDGRITALLPEASLNSRSLRVRVELPNPDGRLRPGLTASVRLQTGGGPPALVVPAEAVIRTGQRALVMLAGERGHFRPVEIRTGRETGQQIEVLEGLQAGQQVVASGQFLLDSEASLRGLAAGQSMAIPVPLLHESEGRIVAMEEGLLSIAHGPFKSLGMPGMTMAFPVEDPALMAGLQVGDQIRFAIEQTDEGMVIRRTEKVPEARP